MENNNENIEVQNNVDNQEVINSNTQQSPVKSNVVETESSANDAVVYNNITESVNNVDEKPILNESKESFINKLKNNKKLLFLIGGVLILVIAAIVLILVLNNSDESKGSFKDPFNGFNPKGYKEISVTGASGKMDNYSISNSPVPMQILSDVLLEDLNSGKITKDDYINQGIYAIYDPSRLNSNYKSMIVDTNLLDSVVAFTYDNKDTLSADTLINVLKYYYMVDIDDSKLSNTSSSLNEGRIMKLSKTGSLNDFDSALLSSDGHFIVYYSTKGENACTKNYAQNVANIAEDAVKAFKNNYGYDFKFSLNSFYDGLIDEYFVDLGAVKKANAIKNFVVLELNNIPLEKMKTAMPIYIIKYPGSIIGKYTGSGLGDERHFVDLMVNLCKADPTSIEGCDRLLELGKENMNAVANMFKTMYIAPNFVVNSDSNSEDIKIITTHELFHHYQNTHICVDNSCPDGDFPSEATANLAVVQSIKKSNLFESILGGHATAYSQDTALPIDEQRSGYPAYIFMYNYANMVKNGTSIAMNSEKHQSVLIYLENNSSGKYKDVMIKTAEGNLTLDYSNKLLLPYRDGRINMPSDYKKYNYQSDAHDSVTIKKSSSHYYYIKPYTNLINEKTQVTLSGNTSDITVVLLARHDSTFPFTELYRQELTKDFVITPRDFTGKYGELAIMVVDTASRNVDNYDFDININGGKENTFTVKNIKNDEKNNKLGISEADLARAKGIYCKKSDPKSSSMKQTSEVLVNYKDSKRIKDLYVKETLDASDLDKSSPAYNLAKSLMDVSFQGIEQLFNLYFKEAKTIYSKSDLKYTLTVKLPEEYFDNLGDVYNFEGNRKIDIVKGLTEEGFTCYLRY